MIRERVLQLGADRALNGLWCSPDGEIEAGSASRCLVLFWNAGLIHRVGPNRLFVQMARDLAARGVPSCRFDVSGLGDSAYRESVPGRRAPGEVAEVMDGMEAFGYRDFILVGLCSGADEAHAIAVADERVRGVVHLDGYGERTAGYYLHFYGQRLLRPRSWLGAMRSGWTLLKRLAGKVLGKPLLNRGELVVFERDFPTRETFREQLRELVRRRTRLFYVYTGGVSEYYCYSGQFQEMLREVDLCGCVNTAHFFAADHLYSDPQVRKTMIREVGQWVARTAAS